MLAADHGGAGPRLDLELVRRGLFASRPRAAAAILAGEVLLDGRPARKAGQPAGPGSDVRLRVPDHPYVGRGGVKLAAALDAFALSPAGLVCLDVGASTGGFTDCMLQHGALRVYAVDVGYGQLAWRLRRDPRVIVRERVNARYLTRSEVPEAVDFATCDLSFISLAKVLPAVGALVRMEPGRGDLVCLIKPQFEAGPADVPDGGVVRDPSVHRRVLATVLAAADTLGWRLQGLAVSPLRGADGNREFLGHFRREAAATPWPTWVDRALAAVADRAGSDR